MKYALLVVLSLSSFANAAFYYEDLKTRNGETSVGWEYSTAICETPEDHYSTKIGRDGWFWVTISKSEFCRLIHQHRSNGCRLDKVKNFWGFWEELWSCGERDRMVSWCNVHRDLWDKHYRCRNLNAALDSERESLQRKREAAYKRWQKKVEAKKRALLLANDPVRQQLENLVAERKARIELLKQEEEEAAAAFERDLQTMKAFGEFQNQTIAELNKGFRSFDELVGQLEENFALDAQETQGLVEAVKTGIQTTVSASVTMGQLNQLSQDLQNRYSQALVCQSSRAGFVLGKLHAKFAELGGIVSTYEHHLSSLGRSHALETFKASLQDNLNVLSAEVAKRGGAFTEDVERLNRKPSVCGLVDSALAFYEARKTLLGNQILATGLNSLTVEFATAFKAQSDALVRDKQTQGLRRYLDSLQAQVTKSLHEGQVAVALASIASARSRAVLALARLSEVGLSEQDCHELNQEVETVVASLESQRSDAQNLQFVRGRLTQRLQRLAVSLIPVRQASLPVPLIDSANQALAASKKVMGEALTVTTPPQFQNIDEALVFEARLGEAENKVVQFNLAAKLSGGVL